MLITEKQINKKNKKHVNNPKKDLNKEVLQEFEQMESRKTYFYSKPNKKSLPEKDFVFKTKYIGVHNMSDISLRKRATKKIFELLTINELSTIKVEMDDHIRHYTKREIHEFLIKEIPEISEKWKASTLRTLIISVIAFLKSETFKEGIAETFEISHKEDNKEAYALVNPLLTPEQLYEKMKEYTNNLTKKRKQKKAEQTNCDSKGMDLEKIIPKETLIKVIVSGEIQIKFLLGK